jgi:4-amino-4-deoxychorismate lyase
LIQFLETICIENGMPRHLKWHQQRVDATMKRFHEEVLPVDRTLQLHEVLSACTFPAEGKWRCRIVYDLNAVSIELIPEEKTLFHSLRMIEAPEHLDYLYKYADRRLLYALFEKRNGADDVLMLRQGWIADTTKANIAFRAGDKWYSPSVPFLAGTTWKRLVASGVLTPRPIHRNDIHRYDTYKVINALNDWEGEEYPIDGILG